MILFPFLLLAAPAPGVPPFALLHHGYPLRSGWSAVWIPERQNGRG